MNTKTIIISSIIVLVILAGGALLLTNKSSTTIVPVAAQQQGTASSSPTTVQAQDVTVGTGASATPGMLVSVLYVGKLTNGTTFDSSAAHNNQPLTFALGTQGLIPGFQIGVNGMKVGGERIMAIPAGLGYGAQDVKDATGKVIIPANSTIVFDVKLTKVEAAPATTTSTGTPKAPIIKK